MNYSFLFVNILYSLNILVHNQTPNSGAIRQGYWFGNFSFSAAILQPLKKAQRILRVMIFHYCSRLKDVRIHKTGPKAEWNMRGESHDEWKLYCSRLKKLIVLGLMNESYKKRKEFAKGAVQKASQWRRLKESHGAGDPKRESHQKSKFSWPREKKKSRNRLAPCDGKELL